MTDTDHTPVRCKHCGSFARLKTLSARREYVLCTHDTCMTTYTLTQ